MAYTVKKLAKLSGVSVRTLHFYDEIGLLKPAYYGDNHYRYYEEEQLLMLQQILFYRELGSSLNEVQRIIGSNDFDKIAALNAHRQILGQRLERSQELIKTIDKTIAHLKGRTAMKNEEIFSGFDAKKQAEYEKYLVDTGVVTQTELDEMWQNVKNPQHFKQIGEGLSKEFATLNKGFVTAIEKGLSPASSEVQALVQMHYQVIKRVWAPTWTPTRERYTGLGRLYCEHADFQKFFAAYHPELAEFLAAAMKAFADRELT